MSLETKQRCLPPPPHGGECLLFICVAVNPQHPAGVESEHREGSTVDFGAARRSLTAHVHVGDYLLVVDVGEPLNLPRDVRKRRGYQRDVLPKPFGTAKG